MAGSAAGIRREMSMTGWARWIVLVGALLTLANVGWVAAGAHLSPGGESVSEGLFLAVGFISVGLALRLALKHRGRGLTLWAWTLFAASLAAFWLGEVFWVVEDTWLGGAVSPSWADVGYLAYYPLLAVALFLLSLWSHEPVDRLRVVLDMLTIMLGAGLLVWYFVLRPVLEDSGHALADVISVAYPIGDLVLILGIAALAVRPNRLRRRAAVHALLTAVLVGFVADLAYGYTQTLGTYQNAGVIDVVYVVQWFLFGLVAALESSPAQEGDGADAERQTSPRGSFLLASVALVFALGVLIWALVDVFDGLEGTIAVIAVLFTLLSMARQVLVMRESSRLRERQAVAASEEYYEGVMRRTQFSVDHAFDAIMWSREDGTIVDVNEAACRGSGYTRQELLGLTVFDVDAMLAANPDMWQRGWELSQGTGSVLVESVRRTKQGRTYPIEVRLDFLTYNEEHLICAFTRDISDRKAAEEALRKTEEQLRQSQKMEAIGQLAGGIAHDFNNLLAVISGYSELVLSSGETPDPQQVRTALDAIKTAADRGAALTRQILQFSRRAPLKSEVIEVNTLVEDSQKLLHRTLGEDIVLVTELDPEAGRTRLDVNAIHQAITNLAINARDAMPHGGTLSLATRNVELDARFCTDHPEIKPGPYVLLTVSDTGVGMDAATRDRAFEPFFTTKEVGKGTGLGLSSVYGTVRQNRGLVTFESEPGRGTTFNIYLPRVENLVADALDPAAYD